MVIETEITRIRIPRDVSVPSAGITSAEKLIYDATKAKLDALALAGLVDTAGLGVATDGQIAVMASGEWVPADLPTGAAWGGITGTLEDQTDLQDALDGKAASDHVHTLPASVKTVFASSIVSTGTATIVTVNRGPFDVGVPYLIEAAFYVYGQGLDGFPATCNLSIECNGTTTNSNEMGGLEPITYEFGVNTTHLWDGAWTYTRASVGDPSILAITGKLQFLATGGGRVRVIGGWLRHKVTKAQ